MIVFMGKSIEDPVYGDDCSGCFDAGKTPNIIFAAFTGMTLCDYAPCRQYGSAPLNQVLILEQDVHIPCYFVWHQGDWKAEAFVGPAPGGSWVALTFRAEFLVFFADDPGDCVTHFTNELTCGDPGVCGEGGSCVLAWNVNLLDILWEYNLFNMPHTYFEFAAMADPYMVINFRNRNGKTNIHVKYDTS